MGDATACLHFTFQPWVFLPQAPRLQHHFKPYICTAASDLSDHPVGRCIQLSNNYFYFYVANKFWMECNGVKGRVALVSATKTRNFWQVPTPWPPQQPREGWWEKRYISFQGSTFMKIIWGLYNYVIMSSRIRWFLQFHIAASEDLSECTEPRSRCAPLLGLSNSAHYGLYHRYNVHPGYRASLEGSYELHLPPWCHFCTHQLLDQCLHDHFCNIY